MLNIKYIKENINKVKEAILHKNVDCDLDAVFFLDDKRRDIIVQVEKLKAERNNKNKLISTYRKDKKDSSDLINDLLKDSNASIVSFTRFEVGEGIEVEKIDFASEVMSQIEG